MANMMMGSMQQQQGNQQQGGQQQGGQKMSQDEILASIEKLAKLKDAGALTQEEFDAKKKDLLSKL
jgi:membrane protease subunit (stomatin/prohibitin family)